MVSSLNDLLCAVVVANIQEENLVRYCLLIFAVINLTFGGWSLCQSLHRLRKWSSAGARVVGLEKRSTSGESTSTAYYPIVSFSTEAGDERTFINRVGLIGGHYSVGERVEILYDPANPDRAMIDDWTTLWIMTAVGLGTGTVFALLTWIFW